MLLFSGAAGPGTVAPYESVHTSDAGLLFQRPAADMQALLAQLDLDPVRLPGEPPDHIAVELAVLAEALRRDDAATAARLLHHHLLRWAPDFAELCQAHDPHGLYAAAAALLTPLLHRACDLIQAPANPPSMKENVP
jgi:TorA-specific chaperone